MVEENAVAGKHIVRFAIVDCYPIRIELGRCVRTAGIEWRGVTLWCFLHFSIEFTRRGPVESGLIFKFQYSDRFE